MGGYQEGGKSMRITIDYDLTPEQVEKLARIGESRGRSGRSPEAIRQTFDEVVWTSRPDIVAGWIDMEVELLDFGDLERL